MRRLVEKGAMVVVGAVCLALAAGSVARAEIGPSLYRIGEYGSGAGQFTFEGGGIAGDPTTGHLFISDRLNNRISEFTAWGEFVKAWGWGVANGASAAQTCGPALPTLEPEVSLCQAGISGSKAGQLLQPGGIALSPSGELYVFERDNHRVQVFTKAGAFVRMFGGGVNKTTGEDICTAADIVGGEECGAGVEGTGNSEFSVQQLVRTGSDYIDIAASGTVYVADRNRIQVFEADGTYVKSLPLPEPGNPGAMALDPASGDIYFSYRWGVEAAKSYRLDESTGAVIYPLPATAPEAFAPGPGGAMYLSDDPVPADDLFGDNPRLLELNSLGEVVVNCCESATKPGEQFNLPAIATNVVTAGGGVDLYAAHYTFTNGGAAFIDVRGPAPEKFLPPPTVPPSIEAQSAISVGEDEATVRADINPNFWADTSYHLEYGTAPCSGGGCISTSEEELGAGIVKKAVQTDPIELLGLEAGTTYHFRFVAESGGGGPVVGPDATFTTFSEEPDVGPCANDAFRPGGGARLADCRAYEMVSPVNKSGGDILVQGNINAMQARLNQAAPTGDAITYSSYRSYGDAESAPFTSQYMANRGSTTWSSDGISPPISPPPLIGDGLDSQYQGFSEDLSSGWLFYNYTPLLAPGAIAGRPNLYRRDNVAGSFETLSTAAPIGVLAEGPAYELQGFSSDGTRTVFRAQGKLTANAASDQTVIQTYEAFNGNVRLVSVKPEGSAATTSSSAGSLGGNLSREGNTETAVSDDGTKIYWSADKLYVRVNTVKTVAVSTGAARFWAATPTGSQAIYSQEGALKLFTLATESSATLVASGVQGVVGASDDLTRIYFVSTAALAGAAQAGKPNLYFYEEGQPLKFLGAVSATDLVSSSEPSLVSLSPFYHVAHVSSDGSVAVFMSRAALTGADNVDYESGEPDAEVFRYDANDDELLCVSCISTGAAPAGRKLQIRSGEESSYWYASRIPTWEFQLHAPRVIAADGNRIFFNSLSRLVPADTNGREDVYQWEAVGTGTCTEGAPGFKAIVGGCVTLISSGEDERDSEFVDASADGDDVFFLTGESLVGWDPGQIDLYDARAEGGLPAPPPARGPECEGEGCQPQGSPPPAPPTNVSESFVGPGNPKSKPPCRKGFVRKHGKCVKKPKKGKGKGKHKQAKHKSGRAGR